MKLKQGFTLIEVSMVLLVMALIAGGILLGKTVVEASKVRAQVSQIEEFKVATSLFRESFSKLPGDIGPERMNQYFPVAFPLTGSYAQHSGDENNMLMNVNLLQYSPPSLVLNYELDSFFAHLTIAGMIEGSYTYTSGGNATIGSNFPIQKLSSFSGGILPFADSDWHNYFHLCLQNTTDGAAEINIASCMTPNQAYQLDLKMDDGYIRTGDVQTSGGTGWPIYYKVGYSGGGCYDGSSDSGYKLSNTNIACAVRINMGVDSGYKS